jgi:glucan 1,3-beta-glucosidase
MMLTMSAGDRELGEYLAFVADRFAGTVREAARGVPLMIGEWCLDTASKKPLDLTVDERRSYFRRIADAQLRAWEPAVAWTYWNYKLDSKDPQRRPVSHGPCHRVPVAARGARP